MWVTLVNICKANELSDSTVVRPIGMVTGITVVLPNSEAFYLEEQGDVGRSEEGY